MRALPSTTGLACLALGACSTGGPDDVSTQVLNTPVFIVIAGRVFAAPVAEVTSVTKPGDCNCTEYSPADEDTGRRDAEKLAQDGARETHPVSAGHISISPGQSYERVGVNSACASSSVSWRCRAQHKGVMDDLPQDFTIADTNYLQQFKSHFTIGGESVFDHLNVVTPFRHEVKLACDRSSTFCTAAVLLSPQVVAIWDVWQDDRPAETSQAMAARQARALSAVANGR
jgi:hypothetical protein